jgi:hypothetical protein
MRRTGRMVLIGIAVLLLGAFATDAWLRWDGALNPAARHAARLGIDADLRTVPEYLRDRATTDPGLLPRVSTGDFFNPPLTIAGRPVIPLAGPSGQQAVQCNELGQYRVVQFDSLGFANPAKVRADAVDTVVLGDALGEGGCVPRGSGFVATLQETIPRLYNLSRSGNGPLSELAIAREYLPSLKPRLLIWAVTYNDLQNIQQESAVPILQRYLDEPVYSQGLVAGHDAINDAMSAIYQDRRQRMLDRVWTPLKALRLELGAAIKKLRGGRSAVPADEAFGNLAVFARVAEAMTATTRPLGTKIAMLYLPTYNSADLAGVLKRNAQVRDAFGEIAAANGQMFLDPSAALESRFEDPRLVHAVNADHALDDARNLAPRYNRTGHAFIAAYLSDFFKRTPHAVQ